MPRPLFQDEPETFSTKKERREGGLFRPPPRPPAKSCPPLITSKSCMPRPLFQDE